MMAWKNEMFHVENKTKNLIQREKPKKINPTLQRDDAMKYFKNPNKICNSCN